MHIHRTRIAGFGPHVDRTIEWDQYPSVVALVAANGAGKTFLMEADFAALYGEFPSYNGSIYDALTDGGTGEGTLETEISLEKDESIIKVVRLVKGGKYPSQKVNVYTGEDLIAGPKVSDAEPVIETLFGPKRVAMASWFAGQGGAGDLTQLSAADRRVVFADLLQLDTLEAIALKARDAARVVRNESTELSGRVSELKRAADRVSDLEAQVETAAAAREAAIAAHTSAVAAFEDQHQRLQLSKQLQQTQTRLRVAKSTLVDLRKRQAHLGPEPAAPAKLIDAAAMTVINNTIEEHTKEHQALTAERRSKIEYREMLEAQAPAAPKHLGPESRLFDERCDPCPLYQQIASLSDADKERSDIIAELARDVAALAVRKAQVQTKLETWITKQNDLQAQLDALLLYDRWQARNLDADFDNRIVQQETIRDEAEALCTTLETALADLPVPEHEMTHTEVRSLSELRDESVQRFGSSQADLVQARQAAATLLEQEQLRQALELERGELSVLQKAFSRQGIQALLVDQALGELEEKTNKNLVTLSGGRFTLSIQTQTATKKGALKEDLAFLVRDGVGERPVGRFSGGERRLFQTALRLALTLWSGHGHASGTLRIDEAFDALDDDRADAVIQLLTQLDQEFQQIVVVTHNSDLATRLPGQLIL